MLLSYPLFALLMLLPVVVLHRCVLMRQLEEMATQDSKTGLLTDVEWKNRAANELARAESSRGLFRRSVRRPGQLQGDQRHIWPSHR